MKKYAKSVSVILAVTMLVSLAGCDFLKGGGNSKPNSNVEDELIKQEDALAIAGDYAQALIDMNDEKIIELSSKISDSNVEMMADYEFYEESKNVYEHWLTTFEYTIKEEELDIDEKKATVPFVITYVDLSSVNTDSNTESEWLTGIDKCDTKKEVTFDLDLKYNEKENKLSISNSDEMIELFYDILNTYIYVNTYVYYDDAVDATWTSDTFLTTENIKIEIEFSEIPELDGTDVIVTIEDPSFADVYSETITFEAGKTVTFECKPSDTGVVEFVEGYYSILITNDNSNYSFIATVKVEKPDFENTDQDMDKGLLAPKEEALGKYDTETGIYTNEYFGIKYENVGNLMYVDPFENDLGYKKGALANVTMDCFAGATDGSVMFTNIIGSFNGKYFGDEPAETLIRNFSDTGTEYTREEIGGIVFYRFTIDSTEYLLNIKDNQVFVFCFHSDGSVSIDDYLTTFEAI